MYNLIEYSKNYSKTSGNLQNYYRGEAISSVVDNVSCSINCPNSFDYKTKMTGKLKGIVTIKNVEFAVPLKYLSNFWKTFYIPLINCNVSLTLTWSANCPITNKVYRKANPDADPVEVGLDNPTNAILKLKNTKLYVPVVITLSTQYDLILEK